MFLACLVVSESTVWREILELSRETRGLNEWSAFQLLNRYKVTKSLSFLVLTVMGFSLFCGGQVYKTVIDSESVEP